MPSIKDYKDIHKGKECLLLNCGPSLNDYTPKELRKAAEGRIVFAVKQSFLKAPDIVDHHFWNCCNLPLPDEKGVHYNYDKIGHKPTVWASSNFFLGMKWNLQQHIYFFFKVTEGFTRWIDTVAVNQNFDDYEFEKMPFHRACGPGIMYETVIFAAALMGFSKIIAVGWDLSQDIMPTGYNAGKEYPHFYDNEVYNPGFIMANEVKLTCEASQPLYNWLLSKGIRLELASDKSNLYKGIPRVKL